ncbi:hypothetical protein ACJX0J_003920 (mitochondrion) [Zea mays]
MSIELSDIARQPQRTSNLDQPKYSVISYSSQWKNDHRFADCFHSSSLASLYLIEKKCAFCAILKKLYLKEKKRGSKQSQGKNVKKWKAFRFYSFLIAEVLVITAKRLGGYS